MSGSVGSNATGGNLPGQWDVENRPMTQGTNFYVYDPWGRRIWHQTGTTNCEAYFYGATGQKLETYSCIYGSQTLGSTLEGINTYFAGRMLSEKGVFVATDRLGSVRGDANGASLSYFPWGEERGAGTANNRTKFAGYYRDLPGQDYANARYYSATSGSFWSPDPGGMKTADSTDPTSWNRYGYVGGDPVNFHDHSGMLRAVGDGGSDDDESTDPCADNPMLCFLYPYQHTGGQSGGNTQTGGGNSAAAPPVKPRRPPAVRKSYGGAIPCNSSASQVMSAVENNFGDFGNFSGSFLGGSMSGQLTFSPPAGTLQAGETIPISISTQTLLPDGLGTPLISLNTSVTVTNASSTNLTFATVPGHLLYPATVSFAATNLGNGSIGFSISVQGNFDSLISIPQFLFGGSSFEDAQWNDFIANVTKYCNH